MTPSAMTVSPEKEVSSYLEQARSFRISSPEDLALVDAHCAAGLALKKKIEADFEDSKATTYKAWKAVVAQEKGHLDGIDEGRKHDKALIETWNNEQVRLAAIEAARLQDIEKKRLEDEAIAKAARAEEYGDTEGANAIISAPVVVAPAVAYVAPKTATTFQTRWEGVIENAALIPREYLTVDTMKINAVIRATKGAIVIPGVKAVSRKV